MAIMEKLTPEALIGAPRRGPAVPNYDGELALYTVSTHVFDDGTTNEVRIMDIKTGNSVKLSSDEGVHDAVWIPGTSDDVLYLNSDDKGRTSAVVASGRDVTRKHYVAAEFEAPVANLKLKSLDSSSVAIVVTGLISEDGSLYNETVAENKSSARIFDTPNIRMWNEMYRVQRYTLWYNKLELQQGKWNLLGKLLKLIDDPDVEAPAGMYGNGGPGDNFDISQQGIAFVGRDLSRRKPHECGASAQFYVPIESFSSLPTQKPVHITMPPDVGLGSAGNIRFAPDGQIIGFLHAEARDSYNRRWYYADIHYGHAVDRFSMNPGGKAACAEHEPPISFEFAGTSNVLIFHREMQGRSVLDRVDLANLHCSRTFFRGGVVGAFYPLRQDDWDVLLVSSSSFIDSSLWQIVHISDKRMPKIVSSATKNGAKYGLSADMVSEFWFESADGVRVHSFMIRPSDFKAEKKYSWVLRPHGGPVSSWSDSWTVIANSAAWAEQGYVVILPNISGSTGYGVDFSRRANGEWGGKPFQDLLNLIDYLATIAFLDQAKAVLMGGSYAGYMVNWFFGHEIIKKFCCAVCHDGIFSIPSFTLQEDLIGDNGGFGDSRYPWKSPEQKQMWNPARPALLMNWKHAPPTLIIHSEKDYRCPITEGLAAFNTLQAHGVPSRFLTFSDEGHWVEAPENSLEWHRVVWDWVRRCINGEIRRDSSEWRV